MDNDILARHEDLVDLDHLTGKKRSNEDISTDLDVNGPIVLPELDIASFLVSLNKNEEQQSNLGFEDHAVPYIGQQFANQNFDAIAFDNTLPYYLSPNVYFDTGSGLDHVDESGGGLPMATTSFSFPGAACESVDIDESTSDSETEGIAAAAATAAAAAAAAAAVVVPVAKPAREPSTKGHDDTKLFHLQGSIIPLLQFHEPDNITLTEWQQLIVNSKFFHEELLAAFDEAVKDFDSTESDFRSKMIDCNVSTKKRDETLYKSLFKDAAPNATRAMKSLMELLFWCTAILSVRIYCTDYVKMTMEELVMKYPDCADFLERDRIILLRYCNNIRAANKLIPSYYSQKFRHSCGELLELTGSRRTLGGKPSKMTAMMMQICKREGISA